MITVHHLEKSRSHRIIWLFEELELDYQLKTYYRDQNTNLAPVELKEIHPLGKSPVVTADDLVLAESGAIIETIIEQYGEGRLKPAENSAAMIRYRYWMHAAEGSLMPALVLKLIFSKLETTPPWFIRPISRAISKKVNEYYIMPNIKGLLTHMDSELSKSKWFTGDDFTAADIQMSYGVEALCSRDEVVSNYPNLKDYFERIKARKAYQLAVAKGGPRFPT
tara:strand:- start:2689 stop:3354 length:666 start_codon:yes stop_codon:yes gene_type:complete